VHHHALDILGNEMVKKNLRLKAKMIERHGSQVAFSRVVGLSEQYISHVVNNRRRLKPPQVSQWCEILNCTAFEVGLIG
jgi:hypothetical protein